ncbi:MAG: hypothetical protein AAF684_04125 [Pseudomonadota bacterium]
MSTPADPDWLSRTFKSFYGLDWALFPQGFRDDVDAYWSRRARATAERGLADAPDEASRKRFRSHAEIVGVEIVKSLGYLFNPPVFMRKHGEGQVRHLDIQEMHELKRICETHRIPTQA